MFLLQIGNNKNVGLGRTKSIKLPQGTVTKSPTGTFSSTTNLPPQGTKSAPGTFSGTTNLPPPGPSSPGTFSSTSNLPMNKSVGSPNPILNKTLRAETSGGGSSTAYQFPSPNGVAGQSMEQEANQTTNQLPTTTPTVSSTAGGATSTITGPKNKKELFGTKQNAATSVSQMLAEVGFDSSALAGLGIKGNVKATSGTLNAGVLTSFGPGPTGRAKAEAAIAAINEKLSAAGKNIQAIRGKGNKIIFNIIPTSTSQKTENLPGGEAASAESANISGNQLNTALNEGGIDAVKNLLPEDIKNSQAAQEAIKNEYENIKNIDNIVNQDVEKERARGLKELNDQLLVNMRNQTRKLRKIGFASSNIAGDYLEQSVFNTFEKGQNDLNARLDEFARNRRTELNQQALDRIKTASGTKADVIGGAIQPKTAPAGSRIDPLKQQELNQAQSNFEAAQTRGAKLAIIQKLIDKGIIPQSAGSAEGILSGILRGGATIAGIALGGCWVAKELFGSWEHPDTIAARNYINNIGPLWFRNFYLTHGEFIANFIANKPLLKAIIKPLFKLFASLGKQLIVQRK